MRNLVIFVLGSLVTMAFGVPARDDPTEPARDDPTEPARDDPTETTWIEPTDPTWNNPSELLRDLPSELDLKDTGMPINTTDFLNRKLFPEMRATKCQNIQSDRNCQYWSGKGYCTSTHVEYMATNCMKTCKQCPTECQNIESDGLCQFVADNGYCTSTDLGLMEHYAKNCMKSCNKCPTECQNIESDGNCQSWADKGYCTSTYVELLEYMAKRCMKSCNKCPTVCQNIKGDKYCQFYADGGSCTSIYSAEVEYMTTNCMKTCNKCSNTCQCGVANTERIIGGGEVSTKRKYPWQVGLQVPGSTHFKCGGSIINDRWILTAAHCIVDDSTCQLDGPFSPLNVVVGEHHRVDTSDNDANTKAYRVKTFIPHKDYSCGPLYNYDFALLELEKPIPFNKVIRPICLPTDDSEDYVGWVGTVSGWGRTSNSKGSNSKVLKEVQLPIVANDNCGKWRTLPMNKLCARVEPGTSTCRGDSGGPLTVVDSRKKYVQVGIVSYGHPSGCDVADYGKVFSRVSEVLPWITSNTANGNKCG